MRRSVLVTLVVLGSLISLIGSTGIFAALTDSARSGTNSVSSEGLAASADIQISTATVGSDGSITCGTFSEELTTAFVTASNVQEGWTSGWTFFCLRNVGSQSVPISGLADELTDVEDACSGDEALFDTSCGGEATGELSSALWVAYATANCATSGVSGALHMPLSGNDTNPVDFVTALAPTAAACYAVQAYYPADFHSASVIQGAQSDTSSWRFKFVADASS